MRHHVSIDSCLFVQLVRSFQMPSSLHPDMLVVLILVCLFLFAACTFSSFSANWPTVQQWWPRFCCCKGSTLCLTSSSCLSSYYYSDLWCLGCSLCYCDPWLFLFFHLSELSAKMRLTASKRNCLNLRRKTISTLSKLARWTLTCQDKGLHSGQILPWEWHTGVSTASHITTDLMRCLQNIG